MIGVIFEYCTLDDKLLEDSDMYQLLVWLWGEEKARFYVEERVVEINKPPPERDTHDSNSIAG